MSEDSILTIGAGDRFTDPAKSKYLHVAKVKPYLVCEEYIVPFKIPEDRKIIIFKNLDEFVNGKWEYLDRTAKLDHIGLDFEPAEENNVEQQIRGYWRSVKSYMNELAISSKQPKKYQQGLLHSMMIMADKLDRLMEGKYHG